MENIGLLALAVGFVVAWIIGYMAQKKHWKIADFF
jgi:hypothetical protein